VVTRHGVPVARLVPVDSDDEPASLLGSMAGSVLQYDDPFDPAPGGWMPDAGTADTRR
jgi:antitoxin (DNA-binding transcriptional repressor) of toxin-antitoxin stability system